MNDIFSREIADKLLPEMLQALDSTCLASEVTLELMGLHVDTEFQSSSALKAADKYFAHLIVELPADYEGGETVITYDGQREMIDFHVDCTGTGRFSSGSNGISNSSSTCTFKGNGSSDAEIVNDDAIFMTKFWATFSNCHAEVRRITRGCRLRLQYGLIWKGAANAPSAGKNRRLPRSLSNHLATLHDAIKYGNISCTGATFAFLLYEAHVNNNWSQGILKGMVGPGRPLMNLLLKVNESLPADMQLAFHRVTVERSASQQGYSKRNFNYDYYDGYESGEDFIPHDAGIDVIEIDDDDDDNDHSGGYPPGIAEKDMSYKLTRWIDFLGNLNEALPSTLNIPCKCGLNMSAASKRLRDDNEQASTSSAAAAPTLSQSDDCEVEFIPGPHKALPHLRFHCSTHLY
jgi:hypothetical protein